MSRVLLLALVALAACGKMTEDEFLEEYSAKFCEQLASCTDGANSCSDGTDGLSWECSSEYDDTNAKDCLTEEWTCDETMGVSLPKHPGACTKACFGDPEETTDTGTTSG